MSCLVEHISFHASWTVSILDGNVFGLAVDFATVFQPMSILHCSCSVLASSKFYSSI